MFHNQGSPTSHRLSTGRSTLHASSSPGPRDITKRRIVTLVMLVMVMLVMVMQALSSSAQRVPEPDPLPGISFDTRPDPIQF